MKVVISGGGTGGHVFPAIAIADALKKLDSTIEILFVGANGKLEMEKVPKAGYNIVGLNIAGFQRKMSLKNLLFPFKLANSLVRAVLIVKNFKPNVVIGVGGYASGPTLKAANWLGITTMLQEQNSYAGVTNRLLAANASKIFVAYDGLEKFFPKERIVFTGNPVRSDVGINHLSPETARKNLGLDPNKDTVLIFGGSLGAKSLNEAVLSGFERLNKKSDINIIWQVGKLYYDQYKDCSLSKWPNVKIYGFIEDMKSVYGAADIVVCRAGALTISELALLEKPAILVPSPNVAEDHQTVNAMALVQKGAARMVKDVDAKNELVSELLNLLSDPEAQKSIRQNIKHFAKPNAAIKIAEEILKFGNQQKS